MLSSEINTFFTRDDLSAVPPIEPGATVVVANMSPAEQILARVGAIFEYCQEQPDEPIIQPFGEHRLSQRRINERSIEIGDLFDEYWRNGNRPQGPFLALAAACGRISVAGFNEETGRPTFNIQVDPTAPPKRIVRTRRS